MIDYILMFPSAAARSAAFPWTGEGDAPPTWTDGSLSVMPVTVILQPAVFNDEAKVETAEVLADGSWLVIRADRREPAIEDMPNCLLGVDTALARAGEPYVYFCRLQPPTLLGQVSPVFAGDGYQIPVGQPASVLDDWMIQ